ncbi:MAG: hypothetical protein JXB49_08020, partial [Bacteroidales bacterium]|nr:hypothetical protein [Bacteroidales bacterium]
MEIQEIKRRLSITDVAERLGIKADRYGRALCPFHDDRNPSLQISREKNIATCFSSRCDAGTMDIIGLTEKYLKLSTHETLLKLSEWAGVTQVPPFTEPVSVNEPVYPKDPEIFERIAILTKAFFYFESGIKNSPQAKEYLESRGLTQSTPTKEGIEVGFNSGNFHKNTNRNLLAAALKYGLIYPGRSGDRYLSFAKDCIVFALRNRDNKITGLYFRSIDEKSENRHYYLKDRCGLYPRYPKAGTLRLILTEAVIDAATLQQLKNEGIKELKDAEILASYGVNGLTS